MINFKRILPIEINFELKNFLEYFKRKTITLDFKKKYIFFLDSPSYNNLGDQLIALSISKYAEENYSDYEFIEISEKYLLRNIFYLKKHIKKDDLIFLTGGGNMGDLYPRYEAIRRKVIKNFNKNKIIIFPQTIYYSKDKYGTRDEIRSKKVYNSHNDLLVYAREKESYNTMKNLYDNVLLEYDSSLYLKDRIKLKKYKKVDSIGLCLREDKESILNKDYKNLIIKQLENNKIKLLTTMSSVKEITSLNRKNILLEKLKEFKECSVIITDRLHGMIFSIICDVPCILIDNKTHKNSNIFDLIKDKYEVQLLSINEITNLKKYIK